MVPGLAVNQSSGMAGRNSATLLIRGLGTVNNSNPLIVVDGMPDVDINRINLNDIESISVLKDAASAAIYGARGAFGVVLITTKSGSAGKTSIRYNNSFGYSTPTVSTDFMTTAYDWMRLNDAALAHVGGYSGYTERDYEELLARRNDKTEDPSRPWVTIQNRNGAISMCITGTTTGGTSCSPNGSPCRTITSM